MDKNPNKWCKGTGLDLRGKFLGIEASAKCPVCGNYANVYGYKTKVEKDEIYGLDDVLLFGGKLQGHLPHKRRAWINVSQDFAAITIRRRNRR